MACGVLMEVDIPLLPNGAMALLMIVLAAVGVAVLRKGVM
jgi:hypothetical protein